MATWEMAAVVALSLIAAASAFDIRSDFIAGATSEHLLSEMLIVVAALVLMVWLVLKLRAQSQATAALKAELAQAQKETASPAAEVREARQRLSDFIRQQFNDWALTNSEQEVALLMIKGLSFKEIALLRSTAEKTVRQQASTVYRKANLSGRHALAAWFIEDFLQM